jgi:hypothetical protein
MTVADAGNDKLHIVGEWVNGDGSKGQDDFTAALDVSERRVRVRAVPTLVRRPRVRI